MVYEIFRETRNKEDRAAPPLEYMASSRQTFKEKQEAF